MTSIGNLSNLKFSGLCEVGFSQNLQLPSKPLSIIAQSLHIFQTVFKVEVGSSHSSSKVESEMSEQETRHPHQQATANSPERRRPRKLDRTRLDQDSAHSGQKHTVLNDTETESTFPGPSEIVVDPRTEELIIEEDTTRQHGETSSLQSRQPPQARRRPRKLLCTTASPPGPSASANEGLDARVNRLEQQVQNMNRRLDNTILEISRLQSATQSPRIAQFQQSRSGTSTPVLAEWYEDDVEHVPRREGEGSERRSEQQRMVSLMGNYKIPLPSALSTDDMRAIKEGVFAAGSIAREITTALRGVHSADGFPANGDGVAGVGGAETPKSPGGWARLIEGASQLVAKAAHAIELGAAVEATTGQVGDGRESSSRPVVTSSFAGAGQQGTGAHTKWRKKTAVKASNGGPSTAEGSTAQTGEVARNSGSKLKRPSPVARSASEVAATKAA